MRETLEKLWNEYFAEECAALDTEEERALVRRAAEAHKTANELLTKEQGAVMEQYVETVYEIQNCFGKKAFVKGCEFAVAFLLETVYVRK